jgi:hypothetical protein
MKYPFCHVLKIFILKLFLKVQLGLSPRVVLLSIIIEHLCDIDDRETVAQILKNIYMQHFLGYSSFSNEPPVDASLFVTFRKHLSLDVVTHHNHQENYCYKN